MEPEVPSDDEPIVCTIRPGDEEEEIMDLYRRLFAGSLLRRERTERGVVWVLREDEGVAAAARRAAAVEQRCCAFLRTAVEVADGEVRWTVAGSPAAQAFLDEYARLPETVTLSTEELRERSAGAGLVLDDQR